MRNMVIWLMVVVMACSGIHTEPSGAGRDVVSPRGTFSVDDPPTRGLSPPGVRDAVAPQGTRIEGSADFGPHRNFSQPVFVRVPLTRSLPRGTPVFSTERRGDRWEFTRHEPTAADGGTSNAYDNPPVLGWVDETGTNAWVAAWSFSDHGAATTEESPVPLSRIGDKYGVTFVCSPSFASGVWIGPPVANLAGVRFEGDAFRTAAFRRAWEDVLLHSAATPEEAQAVADVLDWIERRFSVVANTAERTTESPWMLRRFRALWGEYRAWTRTSFNRATWKYTTLTNTAARVDGIFEVLNGVRDGVEISRDVWSELLAHATAMGVTDARIRNARQILLASTLANDPAAVAGFDAAAEAIEQRQREALQGNLQLLLAAGRRAVTTAATIGLQELTSAGFKLVARQLGRGAWLMGALAEDLLTGTVNETNARATLCAHSNIVFYTTWSNVESARELARDRDEIILASQELMAKGAQAFLRGENSSLSERAIYASLQYAWPTLRQGMELQQRYFASLEESSRTRLRELVAQRMSNNTVDPDGAPDASTCRSAAACDACLDIAGCAWCSAGSECVPTDGAARGLSCATALVTTPAACTPAPAPTPPAPTDDPCRRFANDCRRCVVEAGCGFCMNTCRRATPDGAASADGACRGVGWTRIPSACGPVPQPPRPRCPCWGGTGAYCTGAVGRYAAEHTCEVPSELLANPNALLRCTAAGWSQVASCAHCVEAPVGYPDRCGS